MRSLLPKPEASVREALMDYSLCLARQAAYIENLSSAPVWDHTAAEYLPRRQAFQRILEEVGKATRFIFMEYFIIEEGLMWNTMLALLQRRSPRSACPSDVRRPRYHPDAADPL